MKANYIEKKSIFEIIASTKDEKRMEVFSFEMMNKTRQMGVPNHVTFELTPRCTLSCAMCYIVSEANDCTNRELTTEEWKTLAKQTVQCGAETITLTGGEPMCRKDFFEIYDYVYDLGVQIIIMTNATLINEYVIEKFLERPPMYICVTLYGMSSETYDKQCKNRDAFNSVMHALEGVKANGLPLIVQSTITKFNVKDLNAIKSYVKVLDVAFRYNKSLFAARACSAECLNDVKVEDEDDRFISKDMIEENFRENEPIIERGIRCGAATNSYHINWKGEMQPCIIFDAIKYLPLEDGVCECWNKLVEWASNVPQIIECQHCSYYRCCNHHCLANHYNDTHEFGKPSPRLCYKVQHGIKD